MKEKDIRANISAIFPEQMRKPFLMGDKKL